MSDGARARLESPVGPITLIERDGAIVELEWDSSGDIVQTGVLGDAVAQLQEYFAGSRQQFDLPLKPRGSEFQQKFYAALGAIPYGETRTYGDLAAELGVSAQAIGQACGANPIAILIPCHRVLGATGLGGFSGAGGVEAKIELLKLEGAASLLI
ncbi:methylated-DNA-[protein]-cysteine S-methyltransferase [Litoreibacter halocynthiae]|uniref:Methylated-DNA--protein-cysteine methyltransferase n=1 Tax=Litoreibacter halocynthiae TaxID=1242689 RepID=A0A4R7LLJ7_9RHOB|nr:methylated-DNA--[protein]-cysteine S-methyltransferase [Litoreibacter halocynthiae]TDT75311.1 methylated-DNA-[protein]-cysteine S-methyltransferase [Litoreibacter halocynthiae]